MNRPTTTLLLLGNLLLLLGGINWMTMGKEHHLANGTRLLLRITRFDPRSLMQGDYMALRYSIAGTISAHLPEAARGDGQAVIAIDEHDIGEFRRLADDQPLAEGEHLLHFRIRSGRGSRARVAAEEFFFQEGRADEFSRARYAELQIDAAGHTLLVGLLDADRQRIH